MGQLGYSYSFRSPNHNHAQPLHCHQARVTAPQGRAESRVPDSWGSCSHLPAQNPSGQHSPELYSCISAAVTHRLIASTPPLISPLVALRLQLGSLQHTARCLAPHTCPPSPEQCLNLALQPQFSGRFLRAAPQDFILTQKHSWFPVKAQRLKNSTCPCSTESAKSQIQFCNRV